MKTNILFLTLIVAMILATGCTQAPPAQTPTTTNPTPGQVTTIMSIVPVPAMTPPVSANTIKIKNFAFDPATYTVKAGSTVRWVNEDTTPHSIKFSGTSGLSGSDTLSSGQSFSQKFDKPETYEYHCSIHPGMTGTIIVE